MKTRNLLAFVCLPVLLGACATVETRPEKVESPVLRQEQIAAQKAVISVPATKSYKRKIALARFSNETNYGRTLMTDEQFDRIGKQASDMLASRLVKSGKFLVFERPDLARIEKEQRLSGDASLVGVDTLIVGAVTEFGRFVGGKTGFMSSTKMQIARAKVEVRLVDVKTGHAFFSASGTGEATTESGEIAGFGSRADYDATLNDRAIAAAISDMMDKLVSTLEERRWRTDILSIEGNQLYISGGSRQGLKPGDELQVMLEGEKRKSGQSGFVIELPPKKVATGRVLSFFGDTETNEGAVLELLEGRIDRSSLPKLYVTDMK
jgi:curli biogenesis system outer membrane secretion channel CsgG